MAIAHFFSIKDTVLLIPYDISFYAYQYGIISFTICTYIALIYSVSQHPAVALNAIIVLVITVLGMSS